jgi:hypothetical protein
MSIEINQEIVRRCIDGRPLSARSATAFLYTQGRQPWNPRDSHNANRSTFAAAKALRDGAWQEVNASSGDSWSLWRHSQLRRGTKTYKLYIGVKVSDFAEALLIVSKIANDLGAHALKFAKTQLAICRPDKFILYFSTSDVLLRAVGELIKPLCSLSAQYPPFTSPIQLSCLSWARDPLRTPERIEDETTSWRSWICHTTAALIMEAQSRPIMDDCIPQVLLGLEQRGVDTNRWLAKDFGWGGDV